MKQKLTWLKNNWLSLSIAVCSLAILFFICYYNLSSITESKLSSSEIATISSSSSGERIWNNPLFLPIKITQYLTIKLGIATTPVLRAISASFGFALVIIFFLLARIWFSAKISWIASAMLVSSGLFLNYARLATPDILTPLFLLGLTWSGWWVFQSKRSNLKLVLSMIILASSLYIPGLLWFTLLVVLIQRKHLSTTLRKINISSSIIAGSLLFLLVLPLLRAIIIDPNLLIRWLALPSNFNLLTFLRELISVPASLIVRAPLDPIYNLGHLPYLDIFTIAVVILGSYAFLLRLDLVRTRTLAGSIIIAWVLIAFQNDIKINILLPLIYITSAGGIMFLLQQWYSVFPKNPIARTLGIIIIVSVVSISLFYNFNRYFVAWANNPISSQSFRYQIPPNLLQ